MTNINTGNLDRIIKAYKDYFKTHFSIVNTLKSAE